MLRVACGPVSNAREQRLSGGRHGLHPRGRDRIQRVDVTEAVWDCVETTARPWPTPFIGTTVPIMDDAVGSSPEIHNTKTRSYWTLIPIAAGTAFLIFGLMMP